MNLREFEYEASKYDFTYSDDTIFVVAFSGGKDSVAMVLHLLRMNVPAERIHLHHHDVDGGGPALWDWGGTKSYCQAFADAFGLKLYFSYRSGGIDKEMMRENSGLQPVKYQGEPDGEYITLESKPGNSTRLKFPAVTASLMTRWCSACVKIDVLRRVIAAMYKTGSYVVCTGERGQESANRAKYKQVEPNSCNSQKRQVISWRPILKWSEIEVWDLMFQFNVQPHPCYMLGYPRCSCQICIFGSPNIWASNFELSPEKVIYVEQRENQLNHTLYDKKNIFDKVCKGVSFIKPEVAAIWKNQALYEFTMPIIVEGWVLPDGAFKGEAAGAA